MNSLQWPQELVNSLNSEIQEVSNKQINEQRQYFENVLDAIPRLVYGDASCKLFGVRYSKIKKHYPDGSISNTPLKNVIIVGFAALDGDVGEFSWSTSSKIEDQSHKIEDQSHKIDAMTQGTWCGALGGRFPIPMPGRWRHDVFISSSTKNIMNVTVIYALIRSFETMRSLGNRAMVARLPGGLNSFFVHGRLIHPSYVGDVMHLPMLDFDNEKMSMRRITERTATLKEELMAKTWHPTRMRQWCLEYDDYFFDDYNS